MGVNARGLPQTQDPMQIMRHLQDPAIRQALIHHLSLMGPPPGFQGGGNPMALQRPGLQAMRYSQIFAPQGLPK